MKKLASVVLAGALAASTAVAWTSPANADGWRRPQSGNFAGALAAGAFLGFAFSALTAPRYVAPLYPYGYPYPYPYQYPYAYAYPPPPPVPTVYPRMTAAQIAWCKSRYPWYDASSNLWTDPYGVRRPCIIPY